MKVGIMQPYLFPYLGYFQLIKAVDTFVVYDDVQYIKKGWINRNQILLNGKPLLFTFGVKKDSSLMNINQRIYSEDKFYLLKDNFLQTLYRSYHKAPFFKEVNDLIDDIFTYESLNVSDFNTNSLKKICDYMNIQTPFLLSSSLEKTDGMKGQEVIIEINKKLKSDCYINAIGGRDLYSTKKFRENGISLRFIKMGDIHYNQFDNEFIPNLSIIDVLMFNSKEQIQRMLNNYELVSNDE